MERQVEEATLAYRVKFEKDYYDWTGGGKLPGLCNDGVPLQLQHPA